MLKEFRDFIMTGNVIDFAVAVIMAGALGGVINSFVEKIAMPVVGHFAGGIDFKEMKIVLDEAVMEGDKVITPANSIYYGEWINTIINLLIVGFVMFLLVKAYNKARKPAEEAAPAGPSDEVLLLQEIRDSLKK